jgi:hypothetical protein
VGDNIVEKLQVIVSRYAEKMGDSTLRQAIEEIIRHTIT